MSAEGLWGRLVDSAGRDAESCHPLDKGLSVMVNSRFPGPLTIGNSGICPKGAARRRGYVRSGLCQGSS